MDKYNFIWYRFCIALLFTHEIDIVMKAVCLILALVFSTSLMAQKKVKNFSIEMRLTAGMTGTVTTYTVDKKGNGTYVRTIREVESQRKTFKLDKQQMAEMQKRILEDAKAYSIPDKVNCEECADGIDISINIKSSKGSKNIKGNNAQRVNENVNIIYRYLKGLVSQDD